MCVVEHSTHFGAGVGQTVKTGEYIWQQKCIRHNCSRFKTEEAAIRWCEDKVDSLCRGMTTRDAQQFVHQARWAIDKLIEMGCVEGLEILRAHIDEHSEATCHGVVSGND